MAEEAIPSVVILHRGKRYAVRFLKCNDRPFAVVCFEYWLPRPSLDAEFAAERFFAHRGMNAVGILAAENDWFQHDEITPALASIRAALPDHELIGYGGSMGGYASINFADLLRLSRVIAVCPQYSIDPARAPYETRWPAEAASIAASGGFRHDRIDQVTPPVAGWIIYDPAGVDRLHAGAIRERHDLCVVPVRLARHQEMRVLQQADLFTPMLLDMIDGRFDAAAFARSLRTARRRSAAFWLALSAALLAHRRPEASLRAARRARDLPHPEPAELDIQEAEALAACGHVAQALRLAEPWARDPAWSWAASPLLARHSAQPQDHARDKPAIKPWRRLLRSLLIRRTRS